MNRHRTSRRSRFDFLSFTRPGNQRPLTSRRLQLEPLEERVLLHAGVSDRDMHSQGLLAAPHIGASPFPLPMTSDQVFVVDTGAGLDTGCTFRGGGPLDIELQYLNERLGIPRLLRRCAETPRSGLAA